MKTIRFDVTGRPLTQGSMTPIRSKSTGRIFMKHKEGLVDWRRWVGASAQKSMISQNFKVWDGPVRVYVEAMLVRPKKHYRTGKFSDILRADAPPKHIQAPDGDKLLRAIMDALTSIVYVDDGQVFDQHLIKKWVERDMSPGIVAFVDMLEPNDWEMGS